VSIFDANEIPPNVPIEADICVVGTGAAGMTVALELDGTDQTICLIESGGFGADEETQALYDVEVVGHPVRKDFMSRARYFGGTSNLWAGRNMRLSTLDFSARDWVPHSGWPISYGDLSRYYPAAERILNLPSTDRVESVVEKSRRHPIEGRLVDNADLQPSVAVWGRTPVRFGKAFRRQLQKSRNISTYLHASVTDIELNAAGNHVEACIATTLAGRTLRITAKRFILACGGLETARLLLASRSVQPHGVGNQHDTVGRYYMDHPRAVFGQVRFSSPAKLAGLLGSPVAGGMAQVGIQLKADVQQREQLLNNYITLERYWSDLAAGAYQSFVHSAKILMRTGYAGKRFAFGTAKLAIVPELIYLLAPRELLPHAVYRAAKQLKDRVSPGLTNLIVVNYCEQAPNPNSRVYLGTDRDRFGMPRLVLDWIISQRETDTLMRLHDILDQHLRRHGLGQLDHASEPFGELHYTDASHHLGTTRMSRHPRDGVVDEQCRVHGIANLFIGGSGVFPTAGHANPTLTIAALAIRLAAHLRDSRP
jgi:choline dehydrogenase-like flavoprotein